MSSTGPRQASKRVRTEERRRRARRRQRLTRMGVVLGVVVLAGAMVFALTSGEQAIGTTETDSWDLPALDGEGRVTLADFAGQPTVATFFASWCHVCQRELPGFGRLSAVLDDQVAFVGINTMNNGTGLAFARRAGIDHWPLARDIGGSDGRQLATNFGARGSPTTVLYDANGDVVDVTLGGMSAQQLAQKIEQFFGVGP